MGDDLGVGLGDEDVALGGQFPFQFEVVFDDAVVDDDDAAGTVAVGMSVLFGGAAVGGPAGMTDAVGTVQGVVAEDLFDVAQLAGGAADFEFFFAGAADRDAGRVIAAIFETPQSFENDRDNFLFAYVTDDSAHSWIVEPRALRVSNRRGGKGRRTGLREP